MYFGELVFGGLLTSDVDGNPAPYAAESWKASDDQLVWTFKLRKDLKFAPTGRPAHAIDVKKSFELMVANMLPWYVPTYLFFVKGAADAAKQARQGLQPGDVGKPVDIPGFVAADDLTFEVHLDGPAPALLPYAAAGSLSGWAIGDPEQMASDTVAKRWNEAGGGALGPYMIKSYDDRTIDTTFVPNPYFVLGKPPALSQITYKFLKEYSSALIAYQSNSVDFMFPVAPTDAMQFTQADHPMHPDLHLRPASRFEWWPFNLDKEPFNDANMRKAVALSIDFPKVLAATYGTTAKLAPCIMPYGPYHRDDEFPRYYKYDPAGAQAAFKASKYGGDPKKVPTPQVAITDPLLNPWAQIIQQMVKETIGVTLNLVVKNSFTTTELAAMDLQYDAWGTATVDPSEWTNLISKQDPQAANYGVPPKELSDGWVKTVNSEPNLEKRKAAWFAAEDYIASNYLILPATHQPFSTLEKPWLKGVYAAPNWYFIRLNELAITQH
jgi:ABC-type oligopeptide transport system substrate-binding subunit